MEKNKYSKWILSYGAIGAVIGILLSQMGSGFDYWAILGAVSAAIVIVVINIMYARKKSDGTPEYDERTTHNIKNLYFYSTHIFLGIFFMFLGILTLMNIEYVSTLTLLIIFFGYTFLTGIIAITVSKK